jgi:hypothetical protein
MIEKIENIYSEAEHLKEVRLEFNFLDEKSEAFAVKQILLNGVQVSIG